MSTAKKFAGQTAVYGLSTIVSRTLYFILTPILAGILSVKVYGIFTKMYSWASILNALLSFGMETTYFRYLNKNADDKDKVYNNTFLAVIALCTVFLTFSALFAHPIAAWLKSGYTNTLDDYVFYVRCFIYILVIDALCVIPFARLRAEGRPMRYAMVKFFNVLFVVLLNLFLLFGVPYVIKHNLLGAEWMQQWYRLHWVGYVFLSNLLASILTFIMLLPEVFKLRFKFDTGIFKEMLMYSFPVLIANISYIINENIDKIMLDKLLPPGINDQDVGIYGACAKIALFLSIFVQAFRLGAEPFFFSHAQNKNAGQTYARIMNYFVIVVCIIFVGLVANIEILKYFIRASNPVQRELYWSGLKIVPILLFGYVSLGIYMNLSVWYKLSDQTRYGLYISGIGAIITIVLNIIFIPKYSYVGSAWISLIAYTSMMVLSYLWGQKHYPIPYNVKKNLAYILSSVVIVYLSFVVFKRNIFVGNALLIAYGLTTLYFERKELLSIFKR
ncbi:polysaccharide biosynthesis protein [Mucilaginibacter limnophilus]|uniref:Polysaccharide biosynthesis protein n=1 Tax=Mucilaginibacter limnophilus TaxID=1932778 RepID=A0A437MW58_9SPHI|nr:oligosaccharide flippase family protein [Mucilaginibacter limnophilus]RVU01895.1 polysaccharide biosynthesis protein [Mucilaginibacter limnophilus]